MAEQGVRVLAQSGAKDEQAELDALKAELRRLRPDGSSVRKNSAAISASLPGL
jgi:hypothetical protein